MSRAVKWIIGFLVLALLGWYAAVFVVNRTDHEAATLLTTDSLQAKVAVPVDTPRIDSVKAGENNVDTIKKNKLTLPSGSIDTKGVNPQEVVAFAKTLIGVPYVYGSTDPAKGFDCSGFITHVFKHFNIIVPRSSIDFTNVGTEVSAAAAKAGDLILFTGTNPQERFVGHMGIVVDNSDSLRFIHSTSGRQHAVTITALGDYYQNRYVKTVRIFP